MDLQTKQIILEHLYEGHYCKNCKHQYNCKVNPVQAVCEKWEVETLLSGMMGLMRKVYPSTIKGELFSEFPMEQASDNIFYLKPVYTADDKSSSIDMTIREDEDKPVADHLLKWKNMIDDVKDGDKKDAIAKILENQEAYLNSIMGNK